MADPSKKFIKRWFITFINFTKRQTTLAITSSFLCVVGETKYEKRTYPLNHVSGWGSSISAGFSNASSSILHWNFGDATYKRMPLPTLLSLPMCFQSVLNRPILLNLFNVMPNIEQWAVENSWSRSVHSLVACPLPWVCHKTDPNQNQW